MKNIVFSVGFISILIFVTISSPTQLTYFTEHQIQKQSDFIQIIVNVQSEDRILKKAVSTATNIVEDISKIVNAYCTTHSKKKSDCEDAFEASKNQIQPKYQMVRKVETFMAFIVNHEITIKIRKLDGIGKMTDQILEAGDEHITIESFDWESEDEENPDKQALKAGVEEGKEICQRMGLKLSRVIRIEQVDSKEQEADKEDEEDGEEGGQEEESDSAEVIVFKFEVQCS